MNARRSLNGLLALVLVIAGIAGRADAMYVRMDEEKKSEAINYGVRNVNTDLRAFYKEWTSDLGAQGAAILNTEFITLAQAARDAVESGNEMDSFTIEDALARSQGKMVFSVTLYGKGADFTKDYEAVIKVGGKIIQASFWDQNDPAPSESQPSLYVQDLFYYFPIGDISPGSQIILSVGKYQGKERLDFKFDLSKMR